MSGVLPASPIFASLELKSDQPVLSDTSESSKRQSRITGGHLWKMRLRYPPMTQEEFAPIDAFIMGQDGSYGDFDITYPLANQGAWIATTPDVVGAHAAGLTSIAIDGIGAGGTVKAGDIFSPANHTKVYKIIADAVADGTGAATISFRPALIEPLIDNEVLTVADVLFRVAIKGVHEFKVSVPKLYRYELDLVESL